MTEKNLFSLIELRDWLAENGVARSRQALQIRVGRGDFGEKAGNQWVVTKDEAQVLLERLRREDA